MTAKRINVHALPGSHEESGPRKFDLDGQTVEVTETYENWVDEGGGGGKKHYFKVKGDNDQFYTLIFNEKKNEWFCE